MCDLCHDQGYLLGNDNTLVFCRCPIGRERALERIRQISSPLIDEWTWSSTPGFDGFSTTVGGVAYESLSLARDLALTFARQIADEHAPTKGWCLFLSGPTGSGKTHLAMSVFHYLLEHGYTDIALIRSWDLREKAIKAAKEESLQQLIDLYAKIGLLILDDLGAEPNSDWSESVFFSLIDRRWSKRAWTLITSNLSLDQLPPRIRSRLQDQDYGIEIILPGIDYRTTHDRPSLLGRIRRAIA